MRERRWYACRNEACPRHREVRDGQGICSKCGWLTVLAVLDTWAAASDARTWSRRRARA